MTETAHDAAAIRGNILIVDDEEHIREILKVALAPVAKSIQVAPDAEQALECIRDDNFDVVVSDVRMPGMDGLEFLLQAKKEQPWLRFLMITAHGSMDTVVRAMRHGASDFLTKPFENAELRGIVTRLLQQVHLRGEACIDPIRSDSIQGIIGSSPRLKACLETALRAARTDSTVLILGESGTGKEVLARAIHDNSGRAGKAFIPVNCGAIPESLMESELFGYEKGAFTGAMASKPGKFTLADGGTIFLDEIGEMPLHVQVKLLRVLQEKCVDPVGSTESRRTDFRLISATNRTLQDEVKAGRFREDLYYRLNVIPIEPPPLRDRGEDILHLADYFLQRFNERYGCVFSFASDDKLALMAHGWPGNIRELENVVERAVVLGQDGRMDLRLPTMDKAEAPIPGEGIRGRKQAVEREEIIKALESNRWNKTKAASDLGMSRRSLLYKVKEYGIN